MRTPKRAHTSKTAIPLQQQSSVKLSCLGRGAGTSAASFVGAMNWWIAEVTKEYADFGTWNVEREKEQYGDFPWLLGTFKRSGLV